MDTTESPKLTIPMRPEFKRFTELCDEVKVSTSWNERTKIFCKVLRFLLEVPKFLQEEPRFTYTLRKHARSVEINVGDLVAKGEVDFYNAAEVVQLSQQLLDMTSFLSDFDCIDESSNEEELEDSVLGQINKQEKKEVKPPVWCQTNEDPYDRYQEAIDLGTLGLENRS